MRIGADFTFFKLYGAVRCGFVFLISYGAVRYGFVKGQNRTVRCGNAPHPKKKRTAYSHENHEETE